MINLLILETFTPLYSKNSFLGALRSAAQMVSYEVFIGLIIIVRLVSAYLQRQLLGCSPNPTQERSGRNRNMRNVHILSQGLFLSCGS